jgi:hypothetical protein
MSLGGCGHIESKGEKEKLTGLEGGSPPYIWVREARIFWLERGHSPRQNTLYVRSASVNGWCAAYAIVSVPPRKSLVDQIWAAAYTRTAGHKTDPYRRRERPRSRIIDVGGR